MMYLMGLVLDSRRRRLIPLRTSHSTGVVSHHSQEELPKSGVTIAAAMGPEQCTASSGAQEPFSGLG